MDRIEKNRIEKASVRGIYIYIARKQMEVLNGQVIYFIICIYYIYMKCISFFEI